MITEYHQSELICGSDLYQLKGFMDLQEGNVFLKRNTKGPVERRSRSCCSQQEQVRSLPRGEEIKEEEEDEAAWVCEQMEQGEEGLPSLTDVSSSRRRS